MKLIPIHPFPARMAPEIALRELSTVGGVATVLDPMSGSGTVLRAAAQLGHAALGFDVDPLAVLMARVWTTRVEVSRLVPLSEEIVRLAKRSAEPHLPWIDGCIETQNYVNFWFRQQQIIPLRRIAFQLHGRRGAAADALRIALSRIIVTKERGASVARDTSHSRPHRVFFDNDYDVYQGFLFSVRQLASRLNPEAIGGNARVLRGDSRRISQLAPNSIDAIITSPPYLNAIDYLRGHRLSLVWLGYSVPDVRSIRSNSIGAERNISADRISSATIDQLVEQAGEIRDLSPRLQGIVRRYAQDVHMFMSELSRLIRGDGRVLLVVGNSCLNGVNISNANVCTTAARLLGLKLRRRWERELPSSNRYLPMPISKVNQRLGARMRTETLLSFRRA